MPVSDHLPEGNRVLRSVSDWLRDATWRTAAPGLSDLTARAPRYWRKDLVVGLSVAAIAVPSSLGMAELAGVPPTAGLYATMFPLAVYLLFGSSRHLVIGPDGTLSALTASTVAPIAAGDAVLYGALTAALAIAVGLWMLAGAALRLGFMADFLSKPVLIGYFNGVALQIIASQAGKLLGITVKSRDFFPTIRDVAANLDETSLTTLALSAALAAMALALVRVWPKAPAYLMVVVVADAVSALLHLDRHGVATIGAVGSGLPVPKLPRISLNDAFTLVLAAAGMALVSFGDASAITRTYAAKHGYEARAGRELAGLGAANIASGLTQAMPVSSTGSRTAVGEAAGGRTQVVGLSVAAIAVLIALFATSLISPLPKAALGVVLVLAAAKQITARGVIRLRRVRDTEAGLAVAATLAVLAFGVLGGLLVAVGLSIGVFVYRSVRPHDAILGKSPDIDGYHDITRHQDMQTLPGLVVYRFDAALYFPNSPYFADRVRQVLADAEQPISWFMLNAEAITYIDTTAVETLRALHTEMAGLGVVLTVARAKAPLREVLAKTGMTDVIGREHFFPTVRSGVEAFRSRQPN